MSAKSTVYKDNPWLLYNERIRDFIRWYELGWIIVSFTFFYLVWGWWGILFAVILDWLNHLEGGPCADAFDIYPDNEVKYNWKCSANIEDCKLCNNEYDHEFNVKYNESLKWYEKII